MNLGVDGDILLRIGDLHLKEDIRMQTSVERMRFLRQLNELKV